MTDVDMMMAYLAADPAAFSTGAKLQDVLPAPRYMHLIMCTFAPVRACCASDLLRLARTVQQWMYHSLQKVVLSNREKLSAASALTGSNPKTSRKRYTPASAEKIQVLPEHLQSGLCHSAVLYLATCY